MNVYKELENLQRIIYMSPGNLYWKDKEGHYLGCNQNQLKVAGFSKLDEILGKTDHDLYAKEIADKVRRIDNHVMQFGKEMIFEEQGVDQYGQPATYLTRKIPLYAHDGNNTEKNEIIGVVGVSLDVTEQKHTEQELQETRHKLEAMTLVAASIAHEVRTPLASITLGVENIKNAFWDLASTYQLAEKANLSIEHSFKKSDFKLYETIFNSIHNQSNAADTFINMLLMNLNPPDNSNAQEVFSMVDCVKQSLDRYPFSKDEKKLIHWDPKNTDFQVVGSKLLVTHVLFNLIKNALFYLDKSNKPVDQTQIQIWLEQNESNNKLYFKDTGTGISAEIMPHIFDRFFSKTYYGAGIGLTFCKLVMEALGGDIKCESVENEYTIFTLVFPHENMHNK